MKCPGCGAEIDSNKNFCGFCGTQITLQMKKEQEELNKVGCPKCKSSNITFNREKQGEMVGTGGTKIVYSTVGFCKDCGYTWSTSGSTAQNININSNARTTTTTTVTTNYTQPKSKRKTWLWVLGWICIFPLPLTIILVRKKDMNPILKYALIVISWLFYFALGTSE